MAATNRRSLLRRGRAWARQHQGEIVAGVVTALLVTFISGGAQKVWVFFRRGVGSVAARTRNLSQPQSLAVARQLLGPHVRAAIPFRNTGDRQQYIAVLRSNIAADGFSIGDFTVRIIEGTDGAYTLRDKILEAYDPEQDERNLFGVDDIDGDGVKEVYSIWRGYGNTAYNFDIQVYDLKTNQVHQLDGSARYGEAQPVINESAMLRSKPSYRYWMQSQAKGLRLASPGTALDQTKMTPTDRLEEEWNKTNGPGFYEGKPALPKITGRLPTAASILCGTSDGADEWTSYFHWGVTRYKRMEGTTELVYLPETSFQNVRTFVVGKKYVWFGVIIGDIGLLAFQKDAGVLTVFKLPHALMTPLHLPAGDQEAGDTPDTSDVHIAPVGDDLQIRLAGGVVLGKYYPALVHDGEFAHASTCN
jgi:hypothetical protein